MGEQLVDFNTAKLAKEKGFKLTEENRPILEIYEDSGELEYDSDGFKWDVDFIIYAPTQSLLQKWLREEHEVIVWLIPAVDDFTCFVSDGYPALEESKIIYRSNESGVWEDILEEGLFNALKSLP